MSLRNALPLCLAAALAVSLTPFAPGARAASVTYSQTLGVSPYLNASPYTYPSAVSSFPKFDAAGQCLTSVCLRLDATASGYVGLENGSASPIIVPGALAALVTVTRPDLTPLIPLQPSTPFSAGLQAFDGTVDYAGVSGVTLYGLSANLVGTLCLTSAADLALFSGPGTISLPCLAANVSTQSGANSWTFAVQSSVALDVTYNFTDCAVPLEAGTWGSIKSLYR
jgi:hypothetical protein